MTLQRICNICCVSAFLILLGLPAVLVSDAAWDDAAENRRPEPWPASSLSDFDYRTFPTRFEAYFNDRFGMRRDLIDLRNRIDFSVFKKAPSEVVVIGREDMLFYAAERTITAYRGLLPLSTHDLDRWYQELEARRQWLSERGITYLLLIAPEKHTIYPELLPSRIRRGATTPADQFMKHIQGSALAPHVVEAAPRVIAAKSQGKLYFHLDSHWNHHGAYIGYATAMDALRALTPQVPDKIDLSADNFRPAVEQGGDLATVLGRVMTSIGGTTVMTDKIACAKWQLQAPPAAGTVPSPRGDVIGECGASTYRLLMFGDSFATLLLQYFGPTFSRFRASFRRSSFEEMQRYVEEERPDIVIDQINERYLLVPPV